MSSNVTECRLKLTDPRFMRPQEYPNGSGALAQLIDKRAGMPTGPFGLGGARTQHEAFLRRVLGGYCVVD